jgi:hypothetical protein
MSCIEWKEGKLKRGYGQVRLGKKMYLAHRLAYRIFKGPLRQTQVVCHKCDNPSCINPEHLFVGTQTDNMQDAALKGRLVRVKKTHCKRGHELKEGNTVGRRSCRICHAKNVARRYREMKGKKNG